MKFSSFKLDPVLQEGIQSMGFDESTEVQAKTIPAICEGRDVIACAQTGTGKTAAFVIPMLNKLLLSKSDQLSCLVIAPTRELVLQIDEQITGLSYFTDASSIAVYGGSDGNLFEVEKNALKTGANIIVATPGRLLSHLGLSYFDTKTIDFLVLDEADRMLEMGFYEDIVKITEYLPSERQTVMFSATMPGKIRNLAWKILINPLEVNIAISKPAENVLQAAYVVYENQKLPLIKSLLKDKESLHRIVVFASSKKSAKDLILDLVKSGFNAKAIHSDLDQKEREAVILEFKNKKIQILVGTDIIARGIDIEDIDLVINYDVPNDAESYVHRVGRTARASSSGVALTLINPKDQYKFKEIETLIEKEVHKIAVPSEFGETPAYKPGSAPRKKSFHKKGKKKKFNKPRNK